jgi:hypothetical protein
MNLIEWHGANVHERSTCSLNVTCHEPSHAWSRTEGPTRAPAAGLAAGLRVLHSRPRVPCTIAGLVPELDLRRWCAQPRQLELLGPAKTMAP